MVLRARQPLLNENPTSLRPVYGRSKAWTRQTQTPVTIDWSNPLTAGLTDWVDLRQPIARNALPTGKNVTSQASAITSSAGQGGIGLKFPGGFTDGKLLVGGNGDYTQQSQSWVVICSARSVATAGVNGNLLVSKHGTPGSLNGFTFFCDSTAVGLQLAGTTFLTKFVTFDVLKSPVAVLGFSFNSSSFKVAANGILSTDASSPSFTITASSPLHIGDAQDTFWNTFDGVIYAAFGWVGTALTRNQLAEVTRNPWQLFKPNPQPLYFLPAVTPTALRPVYTPKKADTQPQGRVQIDWSNPITRGLVTTLLPNTPIHRDLIKGGSDTAQYRAPLGVGSKGLALSNTNSGNPWSTLISVPGVAGGYSALTTFCLYEQPDTTTYGAVFGAGYDGTYYQGFTKNTDGTVTFGPATNSGGLTITTAALATNKAYALCGTARYDQNFRQLYVDGVSVGTNTASGTLINGQFAFMGSVYQGGRNRCLRIYAFYCWTRELSETEVRSITANPWQIFKRDPQTYFLPPVVTPAYIRSKWTTQPQKTVQVDWSNPLTRGLEVLIAPGQAGDSVQNLANPFLSFSTSTTSASNFVRSVGGEKVGLGKSFANNNFTFESSSSPAFRNTSSTGFTVGSIASTSVNATQTLINQDRSGGNPRAFQFRYEGSNTLSFIVFDNAGNPASGSATWANTSRGAVVAGSVSGTSMSMAVNGVVTRSTLGLSARNLVSSNCAIDIGRWGGTVQNTPWQGVISLTALWSRKLSDDELLAWTQNPWQIFKRDPQPYFLSPSARVTWAEAQYIVPTTASQTLNAETGSYNISGVAAQLLRNNNLSADTGSYAISGVAAELFKRNSLSADAGSYGIGGVAAELLRNRNISADAGSYAIGGVAAELLRNNNLSADTGSYAIGGVAAELLRRSNLSADTGSYAIGGVSAELIRIQSISADSGSYNITGLSADLIYNAGKVLNAESGFYGIVGSAATLNWSRNLSADSNSYTINGVAAELLRNRNISADAGSYGIGGVAAELLRRSNISADSGSYAIGGVAAELLRKSNISADAGSYAIGGVAAELLRRFNITADSGNYLITGYDATLTKVSASGYPDPGDVRAGIIYGPGGIYTGTLQVGGKVLYIFDD